MLSFAIAQWDQTDQGATRNGVRDAEVVQPVSIAHAATRWSLLKVLSVRMYVRLIPSKSPESIGMS